MPAGVNKRFSSCADPSFIPALTAWCVIPFGAPMPTRWGRIDWSSPICRLASVHSCHHVAQRVRNRSSRLVFQQQVLPAGWTSLRARWCRTDLDGDCRRSCAPLAGNVSLNSIINQQAWGLERHQPHGCLLIFMVAAFGEDERLPFDLPEAESETDRGLPHRIQRDEVLAFFIAVVQLGMVTASALRRRCSSAGGRAVHRTRQHRAYSNWLSSAAIGIFLAKILFFLFLFMWVRWTLPRFRYDQLMSLGGSSCSLWHSLTSCSSRR